MATYDPVEFNDVFPDDPDFKEEFVKDRKYVVILCRDDCCYRVDGPVRPEPVCLCCSGCAGELFEGWVVVREATSQDRKNLRQAW